MGAAAGVFPGGELGVGAEVIGGVPEVDFETGDVGELILAHCGLDVLGILNR